MFEMGMDRRSFVRGAAALGLVSALAPMASLAFADEGAASAEASADAPQTVTVQSYNADGELVDVEVAYDPQRIAILDMACLDILNSLGVAEGRVVGSADTRLDYLADLVGAEGVENLGTIKEADLEAVMACEPDVIFIGGRLTSQYDALSEIAPTVLVKIDTEKGVLEGTRANATMIASMFGLENKVEALFGDFAARIEKLQEVSAGQTAVVGLVTSGSFNVLGNDGRCSIIGREVGFENLATDEVTSTHGNESSFETIVDLDPDFIFVMDRDAAIGTEGAQLAQEVMDNELVNSTRAAQDGHIVYLANPAVWYTAEGGIEAFDVMLQDLESALLGEAADGAADAGEGSGDAAEESGEAATAEK